MEELPRNTPLLTRGTIFGDLIIVARSYLEMEMIAAHYDWNGGKYCGRPIFKPQTNKRSLFFHMPMGLISYWEIFPMENLPLLVGWEYTYPILWELLKGESSWATQ